MEQNVKKIYILFAIKNQFIHNNGVVCIRNTDIKIYYPDIKMYFSNLRIVCRIFIIFIIHSDIRAYDTGGKNSHRYVSLALI